MVLAVLNDATFDMNSLQIFVWARCTQRPGSFTSREDGSSWNRPVVTRPTPPLLACTEPLRPPPTRVLVGHVSGTPVLVGRVEGSNTVVREDLRKKPKKKVCLSVPGGVTSRTVSEGTDGDRNWDYRPTWNRGLVWSSWTPNSFWRRPGPTRVRLVGMGPFFPQTGRRTEDPER